VHRHQRPPAYTGEACRPCIIIYHLLSSSSIIYHLLSSCQLSSCLYHQLSSCHLSSCARSQWDVHACEDHAYMYASEDVLHHISQMMIHLADASIRHRASCNMRHRASLPQGRSLLQHAQRLSLLQHALLQHAQRLSAALLLCLFANLPSNSSTCLPLF